ncbi:MAG: GHKL domain-containing protein [Bacteroidales bacterium]|nr:GHKL domain-containing protein [Bacteroidales bacterium]
MLFVFYLLALLFFIGFIYEIYLRIFSGRGKNLLFLTAFIFDIILIRVVLFYFKIPNILYNSSFFGPHYYAHSELIPSLGDLFINMIFLLLIAFFVFYHYKFSWKITRRKPFFRYFFSFSLMLHFFIFFNGLIFIYDSLINDSIVSVNLNNIFSLSWMSMLSFLIISISILTYLLITSKMAFMAFKAAGRISTYAILALSVLAVWAVFCSFYGKCNWVYISFVLLYILSFGGFFHIGKWKFNLSIIVFYILMFSLITTYALHTYNNEKEREHRKFLALYLASDQRDPVAEYLFDKNVNIILSDSIINYFIYTNTSQSNNLDSVEKYLSRVYFSDYWRKYDHQITVCNSVDFLIVKPDEKELECWAFFENMIRNSGKATQNPYLYFLNFGPADYGYIAVLEYNNKLPESLPIRIFVELTPKYVARDLGFPELLIDREIIRSPDLSEYSYAKYQHGELQQRVGKYFYNFTLASYLPNEVKNSFIDQNNYNHFIYHIDESRDLIISKKNKTILDVIAPFSYLFLFYALFSGIIFTFFILPFSYHKISFNFRTRLQLSMSAVILFSFLVIGIFTLFYIQNLNAQKNNDILSEKTHSILVEMQHKLFNEEQIDEYLTPYVGDLLVKFSNVFFTDINLFNLDGKLIASSRKQIYDEKLIGTQMNPRAYKELSMKSSSLFIQNENIGKQDYLSAYIPFVNERNKVIAYLNLPYFAKENDLKREISTFLVAYINIYVILIAISIIIALIISNYVSRPIKLIMGKIAGLNLGGKNEKIEWRHADEIGQLVNAYNRMVDELAISAELLARSERESAWREMAKQVAHEIKNPLTPMKLSVQHLQRAWTQDSPNWAGRLDKFTQTMIEQIDALSIIATEFSDFAKMPATRKQAVNVVDIMQTTINLFRNYVNITITLSFSEEQVIVFADKDQLLRAFNNLIKNAVQAIGRKSSGTINVEVKKENQQCIIKVSDNGMGISPELTEKIFSPYFTTKTSGMGLGLAIVKSIIANSDGQISFESKQGSGTVFTISLPFIENSLYV